MSIEPAINPIASEQSAIDPVEAMMLLAAERVAKKQSVQKTSETKDPVMRLDEMVKRQRPVQRFLADRDCRPASLAGYKRSIALVQRHFVGLGFDLAEADVPIDEFPWHLATPEQLGTLADFFYEKYSQKTAQLRCGLIREILKASHRADLYSSKQLLVAREELPLRGTARTHSPGRALSIDDIATLLDHAGLRLERSAKRMRGMIGVLAGTGMRICELADLDLSDYSPEDQTVFVLKTKTGSSRLAALPDASIQLLEPWIDYRGNHDGPLFESLKTPGNRVQAGALSIDFDRLSKASGVKFTSHDFRRTFVTSLLRADIDPFTVARMVGHKHVNTTLVYDRRTSEEDRKALEHVLIAHLGVADSDDGEDQT